MPRLDWVAIFSIIPFVLLVLVPVLSSAIPGNRVSVATLRERNNCFPKNSSKLTNSFLWRMDRNPPVYFFGTIHVPYTRVWDFIPANTKQAFRDSENAFFELDLTDSHTTFNLARCQMLPRGENLSTVLPERMFQRLKNHLEYVKLMMPSWGVSDDRIFNAIAGNWERKRPIWVMLMVNTLNEVGIRSSGISVLDLHLTQEAKRMNKRTGAVENVEEQCIPLNGLNFTQVLFALNRTLWQQEALREGTLQESFTTEDLIWHYNCGDLSSMIFNLDTAQIPNLLNSTMSPAEISLAQEIDRYFDDELIHKRNRRMADRVKQIVDEYPKKSFFFAFGAGHFLGNDSVLDLLRAKGFEIENIPADMELNSSTKRNHRPTIWWQPPKESEERSEEGDRDDDSPFHELWVQINKQQGADPPLSNPEDEHTQTTMSAGRLQYSPSAAHSLHHQQPTTYALLVLLWVVASFLLTDVRLA